MADEHAFDIVCKVDLQEVSNAVVQATKEMGQRFDFRGSKSSIELDKGNASLTVLSDDEVKLKSVLDILQGKLVKRSVPLRALQYGKVEQASGNTVRQIITLQQGITQEKAKEIVKVIKGDRKGDKGDEAEGQCRDSEGPGSSEGEKYRRSSISHSKAKARGFRDRAPIRELSVTSVKHGGDVFYIPFLFFLTRP